MVKEVSWKVQQANIPTKPSGQLPESADGAVPNRVWKSRMFEMLFGDKKALLELYNAVNGRAAECVSDT
ncbi:MAG: hypothetical protein Q4C59_10065 [Lachnospiraceae bacterium]|nr:hypothetical protein [Lachnospiraceae bacterium]